MHQRLQSVLVKWYDPLLLALTRYTNHPLAKIDIAKVDRHKLSYADARRIKKFDDRAIATTKIGVRIRSFNEPNCVLHRKMIRQFCLYTWRRDKLRGVYFKFSIADKKLKKSSQAGKLSCDRSLFLPC